MYVFYAHNYFIDLSFISQGYSSKKQQFLLVNLTDFPVIFSMDRIFLVIVCKMC